jgi:hypothetical protein
LEKLKTRHHREQPGDLSFPDAFSKSVKGIAPSTFEQKELRTRLLCRQVVPRLNFGVRPLFLQCTSRFRESAFCNQRARSCVSQGDAKTVTRETFSNRALYFAMSVG